MELLSSRLVWAMKQKGEQTGDKIRPVDLARASKSSDASVNFWLNDVNGISASKARLLASYLNVNPIWLETGKGEKILINQLTSNTSNVVNSNIGLRKIPLISYVQAGLMSEQIEIYTAEDVEEYLSTTKEVSANTFALEIRGNSMSPLFNEGDRIIVDPAVAPTPGKYVVARNGHEEATFKKYQLRGIDGAGNEIFELVPINPDYPSMRSDNIHLAIIGTAVEVHKAI